MEQGINTYYWTANNDYLYAKAGLNIGKELGNYNNIVALCAQAAEKFLKAVIEYYFAGEVQYLDCLRTHNLKLIHNVIKTKFLDIPVNAKELKWLGDYYFEARYPGDNFILVSDENDAIECIKIVETIREWIAELPERENVDTFPKLDTLFLD